MFRVWDMGSERATTAEYLSDAQPVVIQWVTGWRPTGPSLCWGLTTASGRSSRRWCQAGQLRQSRWLAHLFRLGRCPDGPALLS